MIPTIAASTAAAFRPSASPAAFPSMTTSTVSPTPAPTESIVRSAVPARLSVRGHRLDEQQLGALELRFFLVETTVPTTLAICMRRFGTLRRFVNREVRHRLTRRSQ